MRCNFYATPDEQSNHLYNLAVLLLGEAKKSAQTAWCSMQANASTPISSARNLTTRQPIRA